MSIFKFFTEFYAYTDQILVKIFFNNVFVIELLWENILANVNIRNETFFK